MDLKHSFVLDGFDFGSLLLSLFVSLSVNLLVHSKLLVFKVLVRWDVRAKVWCSVSVEK